MRNELQTESSRTNFATCYAPAVGKSNFSWFDCLNDCGRYCDDVSEKSFVSASSGPFQDRGGDVDVLRGI